MGDTERREPNKRRKIAEVTIKHTVYIRTGEAHSIDNTSLACWQGKVTCVVQQAQERLRGLTQEFDAANKSAGVHAPVDFSMWVQTRTDKNVE